MHERVSQQTERHLVDQHCRQLTASWVRERARGGGSGGGGSGGGGGGSGGGGGGGGGGGSGLGGITIGNTPRALTEEEVRRKAIEEELERNMVELEKVRDLVSRFVDEVEKRVNQKASMSHEDLVTRYINDHMEEATNDPGTTATQWATLHLVTIQEMPLDPKMNRQQLGEAFQARYNNNLETGRRDVAIAIAMAQNRLNKQGDEHADKRSRS